MVLERISTGWGGHWKYISSSLTVYTNIWFWKFSDLLWLLRAFQWVMIALLTPCIPSVSNTPVGHSSWRSQQYFYSLLEYVFCFMSESVRAWVSTRGLRSAGIATAFRIISRFCLNRIWLEELNQLCPRITGMTLEGSLEFRALTASSHLAHHRSALGLRECTETKAGLP